MIISRPIHVTESRSHWLRGTSHTFASRLVREGVDLLTIKERRMEEPRNGATVWAPVFLTPSHAIERLG